MLKQMTVTFAVAGSYFYYHLQFFSFLRNTLESKEKHRTAVLITFVVNYIWFVAATVLNLHLIVNWTIFFFFFLAEIRIIYRTSPETSANMAYYGTIPGLAWNICFRCILSLMLDKPLMAFDNQVELPGNMKRYPVFFGFLAAGILFQYLVRKRFYKKIRLILKDRSSLRFSIGIQSVLYGYLALNLLGYYVHSNSIFLKFWGIKSTVFVFLGLNICNIYMVRMSQLNLYNKKMKEDRLLMLENKKEKDRIWMLAYTDTLTGCYNRHYANEILQKLSQEKRDYCLCFVDIDRLKEVNDQFGHPEGDSYLKAVTICLKREIRSREDYLFRYGGDEFLLLLPGKKRDYTLEVMEHAVQQLRGQSNSIEFPFPMSVSFGIAESAEAETTEELLKLADERMYTYKKENAGGRT